MPMRVMPLLWGPNNEPLNPELHKLAHDFTNETLENPPDDFAWFWKSWALVDVGSNGEMLRVYGMTGMRQEVDVPLFHMRNPDKTPEGMKLFTEGYAALVARGKAFLQDNGFMYRSILVHINPASESFAMVKDLSAKLKMKSANRYILEV